MSSHHIVRDEQEPALLLLDYQQVHKDLVDNLLEWSPTVITSSELVEKFISYGFKIDVVLCPVKEIDKWKALLINHTPIKLLSYNDEDQLLDTAVYYLRGLKYTAFNAMVPHFSASALSAHMHLTDDFAITFYDNNVKWFCCVKGTFKKWASKGKVFRVLKIDDISATLNEKLISFKKEGGIFRYTCEEEGFLNLISEEHFWLGEGVK